MHYVTYLRVSTERQGKSGLGLRGGRWYAATVSNTMAREKESEALSA